MGELSAKCLKDCRTNRLRKEPHANAVFCRAPFQSGDISMNKAVAIGLIAASMMAAPSALQAQAGSQRQAPDRLRSSAAISQDRGKGDSWTYRNAHLPLSGYGAFIIEPTDIYADPVARWDGVSPQERRQYGAILANALREEVGRSYSITNVGGPGVARMRLTLLGIERPKSVPATASKVMPMGLAVNAVKSIAGKQGTFGGSIYVALEISDSRSGELLFAAVRHRAPNALDVEASLSTERTVTAVAGEIGEAVRKGLDQAHGR